MTGNFLLFLLREKKWPETIVLSSVQRITAKNSKKTIKSEQWIRRNHLNFNKKNHSAKKQFKIEVFEKKRKHLRIWLNLVLSSRINKYSRN